MGVDLIKIKTAHRNQVENEPFFCSILIIHGYFVCSFICINTFERIAVTPPVVIPDAKSAIDTRKPVVDKSSFNAPAINEGRNNNGYKNSRQMLYSCKIASRKGGRSFNP